MTSNDLSIMFYVHIISTVPLLSQLSPENPDTQEQVYSEPFVNSVQTPPFRQGDDEHAVTTEK